jgi:predicted patatin/cPLA2 family phospholipase
VIIIRPSEKPVASRTEKDKQKILETYNLGKKDALSMLENIIEYMK